MRYRALLVAGVMASSFWAACNCGRSSPVGGACTRSTDCQPGDVCFNNRCYIRGPDGGPEINPDGGPVLPSGDGGPNTGGDGGPNGPGSDGGPNTNCINLQCQQVSCADGGTTTLTGKIYDPSGTVPLYNALVYVPNGQVKPFTSGVSCEQCGATTSGSPLVLALTGPDGTFNLTNVPVGAKIPLVLQIGRWRRQVSIDSVPACATTPITDVDKLRMPRNQSEGDIPHMAIATGGVDPFECLLKKMLISPSEFTAPGGGGRIHIYRATGGANVAPPGPADDQLWGDVKTLKNYDVVILPCEGGEYPKPDAGLQNVVDYTSQGGRIFATHYSYVWTAFNPPWNPSTGNWKPDKSQNTNPPDPFTVTIDQSFPKGKAFAQWLLNVQASTTLGQLDLHEARHDILSVNNPPSTQWMYGSTTGGATPNAVPHLTFNTPVNPPPAPDGGPGPQCGRVVYSDFHVSATEGDGGTFPAECKDLPMTAQEKALVFMLYDLASCIQNDAVAPSACVNAGQSCASDSACCSGLSCLTPVSTPCNGAASCTCGVAFN